MAEKRIIETMGSIIKVEKLKTLTSNILENTMVLDEVEPFPGYHGANLPTGYNPSTVYIGIKKKLSTIKVLRITQQIKKYFRHEFDGTPATICLNNETFNCIRIRNIESYDIIPDLQKSYLYEGIKFLKKKNVSGEGIIDIAKHFELQEMGEGIYKDLEDPLMYYIMIPEHILWQMFFEITTSIRRNIDNLSFDGALGVLYLKEITDVVRLFAKDMSIEDLRKIQSLYIEELKKY